jgi:hypothetical protein
LIFQRHLHLIENPSCPTYHTPDSHSPERHKESL